MLNKNLEKKGIEEKDFVKKKIKQDFDDKKVLTRRGIAGKIKKGLFIKKGRKWHKLHPQKHVLKETKNVKK